MKTTKSFLEVLISRLIALVVFLALLASLNVLSLFFPNSIFINIVDFFNENLILLLIITLVFFISELFSVLYFPFNMPSPLFNAIGSLFVMNFLYNMFYFVDSMSSLGVFSFIGDILFLLYPLIFLIILIVGYIKAFVKLKDKRKSFYVKKARADWDEVNQEFKSLVKDALTEARKSVNKKKTSKTKKTTSKKKR